MKFNELNISNTLLKSIEEAGYESPTPIQEQAIPAVLEGRDVLGLAQTGTGKTAAFAVPMIQILSERKGPKGKRRIRGLILTPTRELGIQIYENTKAYSKYTPIKTTVIFGGVNQGKQVSALRSGVDILIATPGRLIDLIKQGHVDLSYLEIFVLDEADRMLDMGFIHDIRYIMNLVPKKKQTLLFSATMPKEIVEIVNTLLVNPVEVSVAPVSSTVDTVKQYVQFVDRKNKISLLADFLKEKPGSSVLVFTRTKHGADVVVKELTRRHISALAIHGNKSQNARQRALKSFEAYEIQVLVATDIASRGIDIHELDYVINYDMPEEAETYVHRIGRTGRAKHEGTSISLVSFQEIELLEAIEKLIGKQIDVMKNNEYPLVDKTVKVKKNKKERHRRKREAIEGKTTQTDRPKKDDKKNAYKGKKKVWEKREPLSGQYSFDNKNKKRTSKPEDRASVKNTKPSNRRKNDRNKSTGGGKRNYGSQK